jgi:hypothetical protein
MICVIARRGRAWRAWHARRKSGDVSTSTRRLAPAGLRQLASGAAVGGAAVSGAACR